VRRCGRGRKKGAKKKSARCPRRQGHTTRAAHAAGPRAQAAVATRIRSH
jgi:hypothetical protein